MAFHQLRRRRRAGAATAFCGLLALGGLALPAPLLPSAFAADTLSDVSDKTVSLDVANADLNTVVNMLEKQTGVEAVIRVGDKPFKPVTVHLEDASLAKALRTIALSARATVTQNGDGVYVFNPEEDAPASDALAASDSSPNPVSAPSQPPVDEADMHWQKLVLQHAVPADILKFMRWDQDMVEMNPFTPLSVKGPRPNITTPPPSYTPPPAYYGQPSVPLGNGNVGPGGANDSQQAGRSAEPGSPESRAQFPGGFPTFPGTNPTPFAPGNPPIGGPVRPGGVGGAAALPPGVRSIRALQSDNSLIVEATPAGFNELKQIVKFLDIAPKQVEIKVEFVTASVSDVDSLGINFDLVPYPGLELATQQGSSTIVSSAQPSFLQYATGNIVAQLFQTLVRTNGKVVQAPIITTTNNVEATVDFSQDIPYVTQTTFNTGGINSQNVTNSSTDFLHIDSGLTITPRINSDNSVTMQLSPQITDLTGAPSISGQPPPTSTQSINTLRTVMSGDTMVLGGLVRKSETNTSQRIPFFSDLPVFGSFFRTRNKQVTDSELLIFVTPTIINEGNDSPAANANGGLDQNQTVSP